MKFYKKIVLIFSTIIFIPCAFAAPSNLEVSHDASSLPLQDIQHFTTVVNQVKKYYVETVTDKKVFEDAIRGILAGLDPHSSYLDEQDYKDLQEITMGQFGGLGIEVMLDDGALRVISPLDDTPAKKSGIKAGDLIIRINNELIKGMSLRDAVNKMRGAQGTKVTLTIIRKNQEAPLKIQLTREVIRVQSVKSQLLPNQFGYIRISNFQAATGKDLTTAVAKLEKETGNHLKGLIVDLRNDPGGLLDSAIDVTNTFLDSSKLGFNRLIVYTKGRIPGAQFQALATGTDLIKGIPMVVLVNEGSASGSEIVAGALQDHKRAVIVGTDSFGKGSVQTVLPIDDKTALKLTTALYYTPSGRSIQAKGIHPDIYVEEFKLSAPEKISYLKESDLDRHFANTQQNANDNPASISENADEAPGIISLKKDYQLREALNILQGLAALQRS